MASQNCIVPSCPDFSAKMSEVDFFYLPMDKKKAKSWLSLVHRTDLLELDSSYDFHRVCARHFTNKQYSCNSNFNRPKLLPHAIPDRALPGESSSPSTRIKTKLIKGIKGLPSIKTQHQAREFPSISVAPLQVKGNGKEGVVQKKVVRVKLPPGMSAVQFASSDAMKNITSKLSGLVNTADTSKKTFVVKLQPPQEKVPSTGPTRVTSDEIAGTSNKSIANLKVEVIDPNPDSDNEQVECASLHRDAGSSANDVTGSQEPSSSAPSGTRTMRTRGKKLSFARFGVSDCGDEEIKEIVAGKSVLRVKRIGLFNKIGDEEKVFQKRKLASTAFANNSPKQSKKARLQHPTTSTASCSEEEVRSAAEDEGNDQDDEGTSSNEANVNMSFFDYHRQLISREAQRVQLLSKIKQQKMLLFDRGKELCRYRLKLQKLRDRNLHRTDMTLQECLKVLKGNMHDHALELLYTQLVSSEQKNVSLENDEDKHTDDAGSNCTRNENRNSSTSGETNTVLDDNTRTNSEIIYTPRVLEAALLFSVAGKKAYKAMGQSLKLPSYSDIIKWKKIIRSDPPFYKKHFPNLRAKFFKKRKLDEKRAGCSKAGDEEDQDGWQSEREGTAKFSSDSGKSKDSGPISKEELDALYRKLLADQQRFERVFEENDTRAEENNLPGDTEELPELNSGDEEIDWNTDAADFIEKLKNREMRLLQGHSDGNSEWENELEQLNELQENPDENSYPNINEKHSKRTEKFTGLKTVDEAIARVIGSVSDDILPSVSMSDDKPSIISNDKSNSIVPNTIISGEERKVLTVLNEDDDQCLPNIESGDLNNHNGLFMADEDVVISAGNNISFVQSKADDCNFQDRCNEAIQITTATYQYSHDVTDEDGNTVEMSATYGASHDGGEAAESIQLSSSYEPTHNGDNQDNTIGLSSAYEDGTHEDDDDYLQSPSEALYEAQHSVKAEAEPRPEPSMPNIF